MYVGPTPCNSGVPHIHVHTRLTNPAVLVEDIDNSGLTRTALLENILL